MLRDFKRKLDVQGLADPLALLPRQNDHNVQEVIASLICPDLGLRFCLLLLPYPVALHYVYQQSFMNMWLDIARTSTRKLTPSKKRWIRLSQLSPVVVTPHLRCSAYKRVCSFHLTETNRPTLTLSHLSHTKDSSPLAESRVSTLRDTLPMFPSAEQAWAASTLLLRELYSCLLHWNLLLRRREHYAYPNGIEYRARRDFWSGSTDGVSYGANNRRLMVPPNPGAFSDMKSLYALVSVSPLRVIRQPATRASEIPPEVAKKRSYEKLTFDRSLYTQLL